jgi:hypothetical protein
LVLACVRALVYANVLAGAHCLRESWRRNQRDEGGTEDIGKIFLEHGITWAGVKLAL